MTVRVGINGFGRDTVRCLGEREKTAEVSISAPTGRARTRDGPGRRW
jgi:hypothetical protein